jgi:hypothetical protein
VSNESHSLLLLPPEIRNAIYESVFNGYIQFYSGNQAFWNRAQQVKLNLLLTCRQIRHEATPAFFRASTFDFEYLFEIGNFSARVGGLMNNVTSIRICGGTASGLASTASNGIYWLRALPSLREVRIQGWVEEAKREAIGTIRVWANNVEVRFVFEAQAPALSVGCGEAWYLM